MEPAGILRKARFELKQQLEPEDVLDYLFSESVFSTAEFKRCRDKERKRDKCDELLCILEGKGEDEYKQFCIILDKTHPHLKKMLDAIAKGADSSKYVYVSETDMNQVITTKDALIRKRGEDIEEVRQQMERLNSKHRDELKQLCEKFETLNVSLSTQKGDFKKEMNRLRTERAQELERKTAVAKKLDEEISVTSNLKHDIEQLRKELSNLEEKLEACTAMRVTQTQDHRNDVDEISACTVESGQCILETTVDCDSQKLQLLPCLHNVCQPCMTQHIGTSIVCKCGQEVSLVKEKLSVDFVRQNKARITKENIKCGYLKTPCSKDVISHCTNCDVSLCAECRRNHDQAASNTGHKVISSEKIAESVPWKNPRNSSCNSHSGQQLVYLDRSCKKAICNVCYKGIHITHDVVALDTEYEARKDSMTNILLQQEQHLENIQQKIIEKRDQLDVFQKKQNKLEKGLAFAHENIAVKYLNRVKVLLQDGRDQNAKIQTSIKEDIRSLCVTEASITRIIDYANSSIAFTSDVEFLELSDIIISRASTVPKYPQTNKTQNKYVVVSYHGQKALEELVEMFGEVSCKDTSEAEDDNIPTLSDVQEQRQRLVTEVERLRKLKRQHVYKKADQPDQKVQQIEKKYELFAKDQYMHMTDTGNYSRTLSEDDIRGSNSQAVDFLLTTSKKQGFHFLHPENIEKSFTVHCVPLVYDKDKVNQMFAYINTEGELVNTGSVIARVAGQGHGRLQKYDGTCSTVPLSQPGFPQYWEMVSGVGVNEALSGCKLVLEMALSREEEQDQHHVADSSSHSYSMTVVYCKVHEGICLKVRNQGKYISCSPDAMPSSPGTKENFHFGVMYDDNRKKVAFFNIKEMKLIAVLNNVDSSCPLWPMFGVYNSPWVDVNMKLISGEAVEMTEEKKAMILETLD